MDFNNLTQPDTFTSAIGQVQSLGYPFANQCTLADSNGNLICYAAATEWLYNGLHVWTRNHQIMPHGYNLQGHPNYTSLLLPLPGNDSLIYLFHIGRDSINTSLHWLFYSIINKNLNGGYGDVAIRDSILYYGGLSHFKLAANKHANGRDWWVLAYDYDAGKYLRFLLTPNGVSMYGDQQIGSINTCLYYGKIVFSTDGSKLLTTGDYGGCVDVFDFNRCTGILSNFRDIGEHLASIDSLQYAYYNCEFSPNGNLIYVSTDWQVKVIYQWNLNAGDITAIRASKTILYQYADTGLLHNTVYFLHKLAPDGRIYIPISTDYSSPNVNTYFTHHLDVIENPNVPGIGCNYIPQGFDLGSHFVAGDMPNIPHFGLGAVAASICDSLTGVQSLEAQSSKIEVYPNPSAGIFSLRLKDLNDKIISVRVEDVIGRESLTPTLSKGEGVVVSVDIGNHSAGIYFVHASTQNKKIFVVKVVKQ